MNKRLQQFLAAENINQSQLADKLGVARAGVSHLLAGRNKPGYDFLMNLMDKYPDLNIEWVMTGKGKMYKSQMRQAESRPADFQPQSGFEEEVNASTLFPTYSNETTYQPGTTVPDPIVEIPTVPETESVQTEKVTEESVQTLPESHISEQMHRDEVNTKITEDIAALVKSMQKPVKQRVVTKVVIFFDDNTFQEII